MVTIKVPRLVVWDMDGTIIDSFGVFSAVLREAAVLSNMPAPEEAKLLHNFHGSLEDSINAVYDSVDAVIQQKLLTDFLTIQNDYYANPDEHIFEDSLVLMDRLARASVRQVIVTNRAHQGRGNGSPLNLVEQSRLRQYISDVIAGDSAPVRKPDPAVVNNMAGVEKLAPKDILVIGDQFVDVELAHNLGSPAVIIRRDGTPIPHIEQLQAELSHITVIGSLADVTLKAV